MLYCQCHCMWKTLHRWNYTRFSKHLVVSSNVKNFEILQCCYWYFLNLEWLILSNRFVPCNNLHNDLYAPWQRTLYVYGIIKLIYRFDFSGNYCNIELLIVMIKSSMTVWTLSILLSFIRTREVSKLFPSFWFQFHWNLFMVNKWRENHNCMFIVFVSL